MTDYLTRLVKRTLGLLPVAQPLITPSFSPFASKMYVRPGISFNDNVALFDQQVIPGTQEKEAPQAFSKLRSKVQKTARPGNEIYSGREELFGAENANNSLLPLKKTGSNIQDQSHPESNFINQDARSISHVTLSDKAPEHLKNSRHRRNPETMGPRFEKEISGSMTDKELTGSMTDKELTGSMTDKEIKYIDTPDLTSDFKTESQTGIDFFSQKTINKISDLIRNSDLIRKSNLNNKPELDSFGHELRSDYPGNTYIFDETEKQISSDFLPGRVAQPGEKDRYLVKNQENYEMNRKTGLKNVIDPLIKISPKRNEPIVREIHTKIQQPPIPMIKVTIGRVEVRAVSQQPVFLPAPVMKKQTLSLDEYLKQHNG